uniref:Uncharacterized protein n=1 Tax=Electrophorus electricus TaxID=8005 RepID=A0A4W4EJB2_ELEEL
MVIQQPRPLVVAAASDQWSTSICECDSVNECCFSVWCFPCFACIAARDHGECLCLPLLDTFVTYSMRSSMRERFRIRGTLCDDCCVTTCCKLCVWCQMARELKYRRQTQVFVNPPVNPSYNQPQPYGQPYGPVQPQPMGLYPPPLQ